MKKNIFQSSIYLIAFLISIVAVNAQRVYPLVADVTVDSIFKVKAGASKLALDPISDRLFYCLQSGEIYEIYNPVSGAASDSLRYTATNHGITTLQGLFFHDSAMFICGNVWSSTTGIGKIVKGILQPNGTRVWVDVVTTDPYPTASSFGDHGFAGLCMDPSGTYIYVSSGARTHLGEVRSNGGAWPGLREVPLTCHIFKFPINTVGLVLANDSASLHNSGFIFASGTRNAYDMGWDGNNTMFAIDNCGERDDSEELNWLVQGKHYGYPWRMGDNDNPLRISPYDVNTDPLVNHLCGGYIAGWFANDPTFPNTPASTTFMDPVRNYGTVADFYRDSITGNVKNASDEGTYISSFTAHRSPLGLVFDRDSILSTPYRGSAFVMSFMPGGDSLGYTPLSPWGSPCPFVDSSRELLQMKLTYDSSISNYRMTTSNVVSGLYLPVDAEMIHNVLYVIENGGNLWKITFPLHIGINEIKNTNTLSIYPNPFRKSSTVKFNNPNKLNYTLTLYTSYGQLVRTINTILDDKIEIERSELANGIYYLKLESKNQIPLTGKLVIE